MEKKIGLRELKEQMEKQNVKEPIPILGELQKNWWLRYTPEKVLFAYRLIWDLANADIRGEKATKLLHEAKIDESAMENNQKESVEKIEKSKKELIERLGYHYPETRQEEVDLLLTYGLIQIYKDENDQDVYDIVWPVPNATAVLKLDNQEKKDLRMMMQEMKIQKGIEAILDRALEHDGVLRATLDEISKTYDVSLVELKDALKYLQKEGSIKIKNMKSIDLIRKKEKLYLTVNFEVLNQKRVILS